MMITRYSVSLYYYKNQVTPHLAKKYCVTGKRSELKRILFDRTTIFWDD